MEVTGIVDGAGHADTQALLHRHRPPCFQPLIRTQSQGPCGKSRISQAPAPPTPAPPSTHPPTAVAAAAAACLSWRVSGRPCVKREGKAEGGRAVGRPVGSWGGARDSVHRRGTSELELPPLHTQQTGHPWAQRPQRPAQKRADKQGTPVLTPSGAHSSSSAAETRNVAYEPPGLWTLVEAPPDLSWVRQGGLHTSEACGVGDVVDVWMAGSCCPGQGGSTCCACPNMPRDIWILGETSI